MLSRRNSGMTAHSYHIFRVWAFELATIILAVGLIIAIAVLLASYNGAPAPDWGRHLNLNALLALLSTILRAALVVIVAQVISQRKWEWFSGSARPLSNLQQLDSGSRGSLGALCLIRTVLWKDPITLAAASVLVVSFLLGPFVQQASRTAECAFPASSLTASLPYAHYVPRRGGYERAFGSAYGAVTPDTVAAVLSSVMSPKGLENRITFDCATGNCTFPSANLQNESFDQQANTSFSQHSTVAMCSRCTDVRSLVARRIINVSTGNETWENHLLDRNVLPNGLNTSAGIDVFSTVAMQSSEELDWMGGLFSTDVIEASRWAYSNVTFLATGSGNDSLAASVCSLYPCMRTYSASVINNQLSEELVMAQPLLPDMANLTRSTIDTTVGESLRSQRNIFSDLISIQTPCRAESQVYESFQEAASVDGWTRVAPYDFAEYGGNVQQQVRTQNVTAPEPCIYRHDATFARAISGVLRNEVFSGSCSSYKGLNYRGSSTGGGSGMLGNLAVDTVMRTLYNGGDPQFYNISRWFDSFADAMTNKLRSQYETMGKDGIFPPTFANDELPLDTVQGVAWQTKTCVALHWHWLWLPIILTLITTLLSFLTIFATWKQREHRPVWKDNLLPLLFYRDRIHSQSAETFPKCACKPMQGSVQEIGKESAGHREILFESNKMIEKQYHRCDISVAR